MSKIIVLMGAPGAGKGTQARLLQERLHLPQISTGDIFRALKTAQTPLAQEVRDIMERGQLVPDELTIRLVRERTAQRRLSGTAIFSTAFRARRHRRQVSKSWQRSREIISLRF